MTKATAEAETPERQHGTSGFHSPGVRVLHGNFGARVRDEGAINRVPPRPTQGTKWAVPFASTCGRLWRLADAYPGLKHIAKQVLLEVGECLERPLKDHLWAQPRKLRAV